MRWFGGSTGGSPCRFCDRRPTRDEPGRSVLRCSEVVRTVRRAFADPSTTASGGRCLPDQRSQSGTHPGYRFRPLRATRGRVRPPPTSWSHLRPRGGCETAAGSVGMLLPHTARSGRVRPRCCHGSGGSTSSPHAPRVGQARREPPTDRRLVRRTVASWGNRPRRLADTRRQCRRGRAQF